MRLLAAAFLAASIITPPALATGIVLNLDDGAQSAAAQLPAMVDNCVSALMLRNDPAVCRTISIWVAALDNEVKKAQAGAAKKTAEDAAAAKKAFEDSAIAKKAPTEGVPATPGETREAAPK